MKSNKIVYLTVKGNAYNMTIAFELAFFRKTMQTVMGRICSSCIKT